MTTITKIAVKWFNMEHAPKDKKIVTLSKCRKIIVTKWIEGEKRWNMYSKDAVPIGWFPIPEIPNEITPTHAGGSDND